VTGSSGSWTFKDHDQCEGNTFSWYWENNFPHFTYTKKSGEKVSLAGVTNLAINATNTVTPVPYTPSPTPSYFPHLSFGNANLDGDCVVNLYNFKGCSDWKMGPIGDVLHGKCHSGTLIILILQATPALKDTKLIFPCRFLSVHGKLRFVGLLSHAFLELGW
jgi:hypothetical protein